MQMTSPARLRLATHEDARALARLRWEFRSSIAEPAENEADFTARCERWMASKLGERDAGAIWRCWVAESRDELVGCLWLQTVEKIPNPTPEPERHAYITNVYVRPESRGTGIGSALVAEAVGWCRESQLDSAFLWATPESRSLYGRHGFDVPERVMELSTSRQT
jgi:GNAT superfamily N-acetyltransferase